MNTVIKTGVNTSYRDTHSTGTQHFETDRMVDSTRGSMPATLTICLLLVRVLAPLVEGDCTVVVNGANTLPQTKGDPRPQVGGAVYTRWGRTVCPQGVTLVYAGRAAGTKYKRKEELVTPSACQKHLSTSPQTPQPHM